jgi:hypothetical protein
MSFSISDYTDLRTIISDINYKIRDATSIDSFQEKLTEWKFSRPFLDLSDLVKCVVTDCVLYYPSSTGTASLIQSYLNANKEFLSTLDVEILNLHCHPQFTLMQVKARRPDGSLLAWDILRDQEFVFADNALWKQFDAIPSNAVFALDLFERLGYRFGGVSCIHMNQSTVKKQYYLKIREFKRLTSHGDSQAALVLSELMNQIRKDITREEARLLSPKPY